MMIEIPKDQAYSSSALRIEKGKKVAKPEVQQALNEGRLELADKGTADVKVNIDPFLAAFTNMAEVPGRPPDSANSEGKQST